MPELAVGLEVEWPRLAQENGPERGQLYVDRGFESAELHNRVPPDAGSIPNARNAWDGTVGMEIVTDPPIPVDEIGGWYREVLNYIRDEHGADYQPCGLVEGGNTAGLHVHVSPLSESEAQALFEMSQTPWMKVLFCSSIALDDDAMTWPVFRGGRYCAMEYGTHRGQHDTSHYYCVNRRNDKHFEWRLPEPMIPENVDILAEFLRRFKQSPQEAEQYAQKLLDAGDDRITSIRRAESVGMDIENMPAIKRAQPDVDPEQFYEAVESEWYYPEIYTVDMEGGDTFYVFESELEGVFEVRGVRFSPDDVLYADSLNPVDDPDVRETVEQAFNRRGASDAPRETEATEFLKETIKKK